MEFGGEVVADFETDDDPCDRDWRFDGDDHEAIEVIVHDRGRGSALVVLRFFNHILEREHSACGSDGDNIPSLRGIYGRTGIGEDFAVEGKEEEAIRVEAVAKIV